MNKSSKAVKKLLFFFKYNFLPKNFKKVFQIYPFIARLRFVLSSFIKNKQTIKLENFELKINLIDHPSRILYSYLDNYEIETILLCKDILKKGDIAIDIGANVGYFSAIFNQSVGKNGVVHSFEPNPEVSELLQENMKNFPSSRVHKLFVSNIDEEIRYTSPNLMSDRKLINTVSINNFLNDKKVDLIKIDIDGLDLLALKGCSKYLESSHKPNIIIEIGENSEREHNIHYNEIFNYLEGLSYKPFNADSTMTPFDLNTIKKNDVINVYFKPSQN